MNKNRSPASSSVIVGYELLKQRIELEDDKAHLMKIDQIQRKRRRVQESAKKAKETTKKSTQISNIDQHSISINEFYTRLEINPEIATQGLTNAEAQRRNQIQGDNQLSERVKEPWYLKLFLELTSFFSLLLWLGSILCFVAYILDKSDPSNLYLGIVLAIVVFITGVVSFFQNAKSDSIMDGFKNFIPQKCKVIREGKLELIPATKLVTGDLIEVKMGDRIPADIRITSSEEMKVDNSSLTGESEPLLRKIECTDQKILETKNVAFFGTLCNNGKGKGIVFNIGDNTIIGQIAGLADEADPGKTPLRKEIDMFILMISFIAFFLGAVFFTAGFIMGYNFIQNLIFAIGIIVANVPEGLLATITITLSAAAKRLSYRKVLVKNLESVETLGSTSCICSDKTGTLTQNIMTVENLWYNSKIFKADNQEKKGPNFSYEYNKNDESFQQLRQCAVMNSTAVFTSSLPEKTIAYLDKIKENHPQEYEKELQLANEKWQIELSKTPYYQRHVVGDASETALMKFFQPFEDIMETRKHLKIAKQFDETEAVIGFNSSYKFALNIFELKNDSKNSHVLWLKGAPERIWEKSGWVLHKGEKTKIDKTSQKEFDNANKHFAKSGERVLGFARMLLPKEKFPQGFKFNLKDPFNLPFPDGDFEFLGLISLMDPPRETVPDAIKKCKTAGIKVIMVTGDQQLTAATIAKKIGIFEDKTSLDIQEELNIPYNQAIEQSDAIVINGTMLTQVAQQDEGLPESEQGKSLEKWLQKPQIVFARTSPAQKLYIVRGCQKIGYIVAVTGDGVNDSPAIKQADIGIAMGITGSDVAKDAADMILLNDDFSAIILGIEEGRKIFDNLKKSIAYILTSNIPELIPFLTFIIFGIPIPLSTVLILCIDLGTDLFPGISFAFEQAELDIMTRLPRMPHQHLVTRKLLCFSYVQMGIIQTCGGYVCYFVLFDEFGFSPSILNRLIIRSYLHHNSNDIYDPSKPYLGNTNVKCENGNLVLINYNGFDEKAEGNLRGRIVDWLFTNDLYQDLRLGMLEGTCNGNVLTSLKSALEWPPCKIYQISPMSLRPVCYSTEALKYAQTSFFFCIVLSQFSNSLCCKTRKLSLMFQGLDNTVMIAGWSVEFMLTIFLAYCRPINKVLGTRDVIFLHYAIYSLIFSILMLVYDETRKYLIRNYPAPKDKPNWFERNTLWQFNLIVY